MNNKYDKIRLRNQLCFPLYLSAKEIIRKYTPILDKLNLTYTQYIVMMYFWEFGSSNVKTIGKTLLLDSSTLTPLLKKLEEKQYITRTKNKTDERNLVLELTEKGKQLQEKALSVPDEISNCINLSKEEKIVLYKLLYKILEVEEKEN